MFVSPLSRKNYKDRAGIEGSEGSKDDVTLLCSRERGSRSWSKGLVSWDDGAEKVGVGSERASRNMKPTLTKRVGSRKW